MKILLMLIVFASSITSNAQHWMREDHKGKQYPEFTVTTLNGKNITHEQLKGKITLLNF